VGVGAGEGFAVGGAVPLTALAMPRTRIELEWPADLEAAVRRSH
jgi:hypothetical protein